MKRRKRNGFVLVLVITAIAIIAVEMFALAGIANTMQFQSHSAYLQACERNLLASGLTWAKQNIQNESRETFDKTIQLDVSRMNIRGSALDVTITVSPDDGAEVQINSSCTRGRQTLTGGNKYRIKLHDKQETTPGTRKSPTGD
ncbi:MAG: type II secretion system protein [Planctomycetota bacterium]|jgi:type II secretory pathway component PulK